MSKNLVAYFSATGKTAKVAKADLYEIKPAIPYTDADLNWMDKGSRSSLEIKQQDSRPSITGERLDMEQYDTIFVDFPI